MKTPIAKTTIFTHQHGEVAEWSRGVAEAISSMEGGGWIVIQARGGSTDYLKVSMAETGYYNMEAEGGGGFFRIGAEMVTSSAAIELALNYSEGRGEWLYSPVWGERKTDEDNLSQPRGVNEGRELSAAIFIAGAAVFSLICGGVLGGSAAGALGGDVFGGVGWIGAAGLSIVSYPLVRQIINDRLAEGDRYL